MVSEGACVGRGFTMWVTGVMRGGDGKCREDGEGDGLWEGLDGAETSVWGVDGSVGIWVAEEFGTGVEAQGALAGNGR